MAVSFCYGTVGSGKTYDAMCRILEAMQQGRKVVTINMELKYDNIKRVLLERGMSYEAANRAVDEHEYIFTQQHFRSLVGTPEKRIYCVADEGHFWWPQNAHRKIDLEDVLQVAMSRKKHMDLHLISQLDGQINREVAGLSADNWLARPLKVEPFYSGLKIYSRLARAWGGRGRPAAFWYVRLEDELGKTKGRKDGTVDPDNKRMRFLDPAVASCYDTLQIISSPVLDEMRDESKFQYYVDILKGKRRPQLMCERCKGTRRWRYVELFEWDGQQGRVVQRDYSPELVQSLDYLRVCEVDCFHCEERGYVYPEDHPDYERAAELAGQLDTALRRNKGRS